ncbi:MAG TPA: hypothetical protein VGI05_26550 [Streptosporangiaceae bacterium]|jgi:hypothetical protein
MPRPRDPLSVAYDGQTLSFLDRVTHDPVVGTVLVRGGAVSRTGVVSTAIVVQLPPGQEQEYQDAFRRSLHYQFRAMFTPPGRTGTGARYPSPVWLHLEWRGLAPGGVRGVVRIGPESARPWISGAESYVDNPQLRYAGAGA